MRGAGEAVGPQAVRDKLVPRPAHSGHKVARQTLVTLLLFIVLQAGDCAGESEGGVDVLAVEGETIRCGGAGRAGGVFALHLPAPPRHRDRAGQETQPHTLKGEISHPWYWSTALRNNNHN